MKNKKHITISLLVLVSLMAIIKTDLVFILISYRNCCTNRDTEFRGIIRHTYFDEDNKGFFTIDVFMGDSLCAKWFDFRLKEIEYDIFKPGDSIYKPKGQYSYYVYKSGSIDSLFVYHADINCWEQLLDKMK